MSAPISSSPTYNPALLSPIAFPRASLILEETASHPLLTTPVEPVKPFGTQATTDDVFGITKLQDINGVQPPGTAADANKGRDLRTTKKCASLGHSRRTSRDVFQLSVSDASSSHEAASLRSVFMGESATEKACPTIDEVEDDNDDGYETLDTYSGSASSSVLESAPEAGAEQSQTYWYADTTPPDNADTPRAARLPATRHTAGHALMRIRGPNFMPPVVDFHRPLPLRAYESEAHLYPTSRAQGATSLNRAHSAGSLIRGNRPISLVMGEGPRTCSSQLMPLPVRTSSVRANTIPILGQQRSNTRHSLPSHSRSSIAVGPNANDPDSVSITEFLTDFQFPIPPMQNPVGSLPMSLSQATTAVPNPNATSPPIASLLSACRVVTTHVTLIRDLLEQTRDRGEQLPRADWAAMSGFERCWRMDHEELLVAIYGRFDTWLSNEDVQYVDLIAGELRASPAASWVYDIFREDMEMF